jgi:protein-glutamine gamma-glutamyltransferase
VLALALAAPGDPVVTEATLLRVSTVVAAAAGTLCLGAQGQLRPIVAVFAVVMVCGAGAAAHRLPDGRGARLRRSAAKAIVLSATVLAAVFLLAVQARSGIGDTTELLHQIGATVALPLVVVLVAQLVSADTLREQRVVLVASLLCGLLALGTAQGSGAQDLLSGLGFFLGLGWAAALLSMWLMQRTKYQVAADFTHVGRVLGDGRHLGAVIIGSTLIGLASLVLLPHPSGWHPPGLGGNASGPGSPLQNSGDGSNEAAPRSAQNYMRGAINLNSRGPLSRTRLVSVPADSPELWAATVLYTYDGSFWGPSQALRHQAFRVPIDSAGDFDLRQGATPGAVPAHAARSDTVRPLVASQVLPVIAPGQALSVHFDGTLIHDIGATVIPMPSRSFIASYVVHSNPDIVDPVTAEDTDLPASVPARVGQLAHRITSHSPTPESKVNAIESYLRKHERYRLDSPVPAAGRDAVDDFLFSSHEGFCEHFASAEAVLLRSVGVPARLVTGFTSGDDHGLRRVFRGTDAHAWVQVNIGGESWVFSDPTAGATIAPIHRSWLRRMASAVGAHRRLALGSAAALIVLALFATWCVRAARVRRARERAIASSALDRALTAFARLETALDGVRLGRSHENSIHELLASLVVNWPGGLPDPARTQAALVVVERVLYDARPVPDADVHAAAATLDELAALARTVDMATTS